MFSDNAAKLSSSAVLNQGAAQARQNPSEAGVDQTAADESNLLTLEDFERITMARLQALADCA